MLEPSAFYNRLADVYDGMTQFSVRLDANRTLLGELLDRHPAKRIVDMGCGTGVHSIALAQLGNDVTGVDVSAGMLGKAATHAADAGARVELLLGDFLSPVPRTPVDLLLCLGNSLPHLDSVEALQAVLSHWRGLVKQDGHVVIQLLNYRRVLDLGERIVNIRRDGGTTIVRFYDFLDTRLRFNILSITETPDGLEHDLQSTLLSPFTAEDIESAAVEAGFTKVEFLGSLRFAPFTSESTDLVVTMG
jgi:glycine/sarcosine N-methyltransferase